MKKFGICSETKSYKTQESAMNAVLKVYPNYKDLFQVICLRVNSDNFDLSDCTEKTRLKNENRFIPVCVGNVDTLMQNAVHFNFYTLG